MNNNSITKVKDLFVILITFALILSVINVITEKTIFESNAKNQAIKNAEHRIMDKEKLLKDFLEQSRLTLMSLRQTDLFNTYLKNPKNKNEIENIFLSYSKFQKDFMQLRFIDKNGFEKIRIDRDKNQKPFIVEENKLQNKKNRYYFSDSILKPLEKVWFSALDLNMEKGKVEIPFKATLRAMYPIKHKGEFHGILIINYLMKDFLEHLTDTPLYNSIIFNNEGYTLKHYMDKNSWGYYKKDKYSILKEFGKDSKNILNNELYISDNFISKKFDTAIYGGINISLQLKESYISQQKEKTNLQYILITFISLFFALLLTIIIIKFFSKTLLNVDVISRLNKDLEAASKIAKIGFWEYTKENNNIKWNTGVYAIFSMEEELEKISFEDFLAYIHTDDRSKFQKTFKESLKEKKEFHSIHRIVTPNNEIKYVEEKAIHIYDEFEEHVKTLGSILDITNLKEQEKQLYRAEKMASMGEMLGNIAHQWRQPLSIISTISTSYQMKKELNVPIEIENLLKDMDMINENTQYLSQTIEDFRNFIKGKSELKSFNLKKDTEQFLHLVNSNIKEYNIQILSDYSNSEINIEGYPNELIQCFINIFNNAKDVLKEVNEEERYFFISQRLDKNKVVIKFRDNAGGIPAKALPKIFDPYFTTKHQSQGTGVGLHMTYNLIVQAMAGSIEAKNVEYMYNNKKYIGAEFTIILPLKMEIN